jgi:predicted dithiol-disulfide oxidoreductase (DUF899 family)
MDYAAQIAGAEADLAAARKKLVELRSAQPAKEVTDYTLSTPDGSPVPLSEFFGDKNDLIVVHNMGKGCRYCTLWADGFNGIYRHLSDRAGFVVVSYDPPDVMKAFAESRDWQFAMASNHGSQFADDMGFVSDKGQPQPGVSTFHRDSKGVITRIAHGYFGPGDDFCALWHMFDMLKSGSDDWEPQYTYE